MMGDERVERDLRVASEAGGLLYRIVSVADGGSFGQYAYVDGKIYSRVRDAQRAIERIYAARERGEAQAK